MNQARALDSASSTEPFADELLLERIAAGDQRALQQLIHRHGRGLRLFTRRFLRGAHEAEDVVQDVFIAIWRNARQFDRGKGRATTWIYRIAANRCIDVGRWLRFRSFIGLDESDDRYPSDDPKADARIGARQELAIVRAGLDDLPARQRMALLLRSVADLDVPMIAEVMGTSAGSVEQLLVRARRALRARLADTERTGSDKERSRE